MSGTQTRLIPLGILALALAACEQTPVSLPEATSMVANPVQLEMNAGDATAASAHVLDQRGNVLRGAEVSWSSQVPAVARVTPDGMVTAVAPGSATLNATYGNLSVQVPVTVTRDERDLVASLEIGEEAITTDRRAGPQWVSFRAFDGRGRPRCDANFQFRSSDRSVATASHGPGCQFRIDPVGPGQTSITVSAGSVSDSFVVNVTLGGHIAFFADVPTGNEFFAGNTVTYRVRVLDADDQPVSNHIVNFDVSHGRLTPTSVRTDAEGYAAVQWRLPTQLRRSWGEYDFEDAEIIFRTQLPDGQVEGRMDHQQIMPAPTATLNFLLVHRVDWEWRLTPVSGSARAPLNSWVHVVAEAHDQYGNRRSPRGISFMVGSEPGYARPYWINGRDYWGIELYESVERVVTVSASEGAITQSLEVVFTAGS